MLIKPYSNVVIDLAKTPLIFFGKIADQPGRYNFQVGGADSEVVPFDKSGVSQVEKAIEAFNGKGGNYFWLFGNLAINLDVVGMVTHIENTITVSYPGGSWSSNSGSHTATAYARYMEELKRREAARQTSAQQAQPKKEGNKPAPSSEEALKAAMNNIDNMIGLDSAKSDIRQNIALARFNAAKRDMGMEVKPISRHMVFTGNPGTGKTTFAREVAKVYHALGFLSTDNVVEVKREDLVAEFAGQTAPKVKAVLEKAKGGVLFIDEAYSLVRDQSAFRDTFGTEAIDTLVAGMENMRDDLVVIVAGYPEPMKKFIAANEGLKSRFTTYISFDDYTMPQLGEILDLMMKDRGYTMTPEARAKALELLEAEKADSLARLDPASNLGCDFGNGREVRNLVEQAEKRLALRLDLAGAFTGAAAEGDEEKAAYKARLSTITLEDMQDIRLGGLLDRTPVPPAISRPAFG